MNISRHEKVIRDQALSARTGNRKKLYWPLLHLFNLAVARERSIVLSGCHFR